MNCGHARLWTDLKFDRYSGIYDDALEHLLDRFGRRLQAKTIGAIGARKHQRQSSGPVFKILESLRTGLGGVRMLDPLHDLPGRGRTTPYNGRAGPRARIDRIDPQTVIGLADQLFKRRALEHAIDQLEPLLARGRGKFGCESKLFGLGHEKLLGTSASESNEGAI